MTNPRHRLGLDAERAVARWLAAAGWCVLARRVRSPGGGEVDLVMLDPRGTLVGLEVRARGSSRTGTPEESVDARHVRRMERTLAAFAASSQIGHRGLRVDLVAAEPMPSAGSVRLRRVPGLGG